MLIVYIILSWIICCFLGGQNEKVYAVRTLLSSVKDF